MGHKEWAEQGGDRHTANGDDKLNPCLCVCALKHVVEDVQTQEHTHTI